MARAIPRSLVSWPLIIMTIGSYRYALAAAPWAQPAHDAAHSGTSSVIATTSEAVRWNTTLSSAAYLVNTDIITPLVVGTNAIYAAVENDGLYALDVNTGAKLWHFTSISITAPVVGSNGLLFFAALSDATFSQPTIFALNAATGVVAWTTVLPDGVGINRNTPTVGTTLVYFSSFATMIAFNQVTGDQVWNFTSALYPNLAIYSSPAEGTAGDVFFTTGCCDGDNLPGVYRVSATGKQLWFTNVGGTGSSVCLSQDQTTVYSGCGPSLCSFNAATGAIIGGLTTSAFIPETGSPVCSLSAVYFAADKLYAVSNGPANGGLLQLLWSFTPPASENNGFHGLPAVDAAGNVFASSFANRLWAFSSTGTVLWTLPSLTSPGINAGIGFGPSPAIVSHRPERV